MTTTAHAGARTVHRRHISLDHGHYAGGLVGGAFLPGLSGDVIEAGGTVQHAGGRSRRIRFTCRAVSRSGTSGPPSAGRALDPPITAAEATGTVVVPQAGGQGPAIPGSRSHQ